MKSEKSAYHYELVADGVYRHAGSGWMHEHPTINGKRTWRSLGTKNLKLAVVEFRRRRSMEDKGESPYAVAEPPPRAITVGECLDRYEEDGYPDRKRKARPVSTHKAEATNVQVLRAFWSEIPIDDITVATCDKYHDRRVSEVSRGSGDRTVDLELNTLRNALLWAARCEIIRHVPPMDLWPRYCDDSTVRHCREFMVHSADELHDVASHFFRHGKSAVLGFQFTFEGLTGLRSIEVLKLSVDATPFTEGWITDDKKSLCVARGKKQGAVNPFVPITDALTEWLRAHTAWKRACYPDSPWFFPSPYDPAKPVHGDALSHALTKMTKPSGRKGRDRKPPVLTRKITSNGCRAFYVTVRRSWGISDSQISFEIGHTSGGATLQAVYGGVPPSWQAGGGPKLSWEPAGQPAWAERELAGWNRLDRAAGSSSEPQSEAKPLPAKPRDPGHSTSAPCESPPQVLAT